MSWYMLMAFVVLPPRESSHWRSLPHCMCWLRNAASWSASTIGACKRCSGELMYDWVRGDNSWKQLKNTLNSIKKLKFKAWSFFKIWRVGSGCCSRGGVRVFSFYCLPVQCGRPHLKVFLAMTYGPCHGWDIISDFYLSWPCAVIIL